MSKPPPKPKNGRDFVCEQCGKSFYRSASSITNDANRFCSQRCYQAARWGGTRATTFTCAVCSTTFKAAASEKRKVCSRVCYAKLRATLYTGDRSHFWRGGKTAPYIGEWREQRRQALQRDGRLCVLCGSDDRVNVHHIIPHRYSQSHALDNLATLCRPCHSREELKVNRGSAEGLLQRWQKALRRPRSSPES